MTMIGFGREGGGGRSGEMAKDGMSAGAEADEAKTGEGTSRGARCLHVTLDVVRPGPQDPRTKKRVASRTGTLA